MTLTDTTPENSTGQPQVEIAQPLPVGTNSIGQVTANAGLNLNTSSLNLETTQAAMSAKLPATLGAKTIANSMAVNIASDQTVPISAVALPLPAGAATSANQSTEITSLQLLDDVVAVTGSAIPTKGNAMSGTDGTNARIIKTDTNGNLQNSPVDGSKATYSAGFSAAVPAAAPTDFFTITGSATKTIRITKVEVSGTTTSGSGIKGQVLLIKRSTANSAGTSTAPASVPSDSANSAATATPLLYTANPTLGTTVGTIRAKALTYQSSSLPAEVASWEFGNGPSQAIVLRGTSQVLALNLGAIAITGGLLSGSIEWTEE